MPRSPASFGATGSERRRQFDRRRDESDPWRAWYKTAKWQKARKWFLKQPQNACCAECGRATTKASHVDHIKPHRGDAKLFWDMHGNWQVLCESCHNSKTAKGL